MRTGSDVPSEQARRSLRAEFRHGGSDHCHCTMCLIPRRIKIVFDVSHQSYPHKMLTGRKDAYLYEEHFDDVSGYTDPQESEHDFFTVGHTSTSDQPCQRSGKGTGS